MKKVSVIMPCYNDGIYIEEAIASIKSQTYQNIELIIIDDGSDDENTVNIINGLSDENIKVLHTQRLRPAGARNFGIANASGEYILPLDADDTIEPDYIEKAVRVMDENDNVGIVYCRADLFGESSGRWELPDYSTESMLLDNIIFVTAMFRRADWETVGGFNTNMHDGMEDYDFWLSIIELGRDVHQFKEILFHYRIKPVSRTTNFQKNASVVQQTYKTIYENHPKLYEKYKDEYAVILRNALIEQLFLNRFYKESMDKVSKLKEVPLLKKIIKKFILK